MAENSRERLADEADAVYQEALAAMQAGQADPEATTEQVAALEKAASEAYVHYAAARQRTIADRYGNGDVYNSSSQKHFIDWQIKNRHPTGKYAGKDRGGKYTDWHDFRAESKKLKAGAAAAEPSGESRPGESDTERARSAGKDVLLEAERQKERAFIEKYRTNKEYASEKMLRQASVENQRSMLGLASQGTTGESQLRGRIAAMYAGELSSRNAAGQAAAARVQEQNQRDQFAAQAMANLGQQGANLWGIGNQAEQATAQLDQNERKWQAELEFAWARFRAAQGAAEKNRWWMVATAIMSAIGAGVGAYAGGPEGAATGAQLGKGVGDFAQSLYDEQASEAGGGLSQPSPGAGG
mgnify:CR=1 FL=1